MSVTRKPIAGVTLAGPGGNLFAVEFGKGGTELAVNGEPIPVAAATCWSCAQPVTRHGDDCRAVTHWDRGMDSPDDLFAVSRSPWDRY